MWKHNAFRDLLAKRQRGLNKVVGVNLVVLGDSTYEMEAAQSATDEIRGASFVKTVKFKDSPSVAELLGQQRRVNQDLINIVAEGASTSKGLVRCRSPEDLKHLASWASGWQVSEVDPWDCSASNNPFFLFPVLPEWIWHLGDQLVCGHSELCQQHKDIEESQDQEYLPQKYPHHRCLQQDDSL